MPARYSATYRKAAGILKRVLDVGFNLGAVIN
jgi:hypothetical protein